MPIRCKHEYRQEMMFFSLHFVSVMTLTLRFSTQNNAVNTEYNPFENYGRYFRMHMTRIARNRSQSECECLIKPCNQSRGDLLIMTRSSSTSSTSPSPYVNPPKAPQKRCHRWLLAGSSSELISFATINVYVLRVEYVKR